jgi:hypothetical protein
MAYMASVSLDQEVIFIGKNAIIIIIIHSIAGGNDGDQRRRPEILSYSGRNWREVGPLGNARSAAAATKIMVNTTLCN